MAKGKRAKVRTRGRRRQPVSSRGKSGGHLTDSSATVPQRYEPSEAEAATAIARAWLARRGFHEDPDGTDPERIEIEDTSFDDDGAYFVTVRVFIPNLDIEHVVEGTHIDGIMVHGPDHSSTGDT